MEENLLKQTKQLCQLYDIKPARFFGQNFLIKEEVYKKIIESADLKKDDVILEVGSGLGFLTAQLAKVVKKVIAVELDSKLAEVLKTGLIAQGIKNVEVVNEDILKIGQSVILKEFATEESRNEPNTLGWRLTIEQRDSSLLPLARDSFRMTNGYKIVANLPYNITSIFLRKFLSGENKPEMMVLVLQKEVVERIIARPPKMSLLAVSVQFYAQAKIIEIVPSSCFWPKPEVDSAIIHLIPRLPLPAKERESEKEFFRLVKIGFSARRKMLKNNLSAGYHIAGEEAEKRIIRAGFCPKIRAQELSVDNWIRLFGGFI